MEVVHQEDQSYVLIKGKRTKRRRPVSPFALTMSTTSYTTEDGGHGDSGQTASPSSNSDEEDMANCLILLANNGQKSSPESIKVSVSGAEVYQCKTCDRCFHSFQALGGHRASHKKSKVLITTTSEDQNVQFKDESTTLSLQIPNRDDHDRISTSPINKSRVHECSICGAEFNSGQALGGHMRRHRPMPPVAAAATSNNSHDEGYIQQVKKPRTLLSLDLNLPAPEDEHHREPAAAPAKFLSISLGGLPLLV